MNQLFLVSSGPGNLDLIPPHALKAITAATDIVAYGLYIDLLGNLVEGKTHHSRELGQEIDRALGYGVFSLQPDCPVDQYKDHTQRYL